jgi:hypothetical protein
MRRYRETTGKSFSEDDINTIENSIWLIKKFLV